MNNNYRTHSVKPLQRLLALFVVAFAWGGATAQVPYSYAPATVTAEETSALGGNKNEFVQGLTLFDPTTDPAMARMKGLKISGIRCYLRAAYAQARQKRSAIIASFGKPENIKRTTYVNFEEGWNEVQFEEPIVIGDEPIYLGVQVYETVGTPLPLVAYAKATVPQSCIVNLAKKSWEEYTDRGTLLIAALIDEAAAPLLANTAYAQNTTHPQAVAPNKDFEGGLYIHNFSAEPLKSLTIDMQGEGASEATPLTIELKEPIGAYESLSTTAPLRAGVTEGQAVDWTATVTAFNGAAAQTGRAGTTPICVTQDDFIRMPLVEEFTSQRCVNCPQMAYFLEKAFEVYDGPYVYVSHHSGFVKDVFTSAADLEVTYVFGGYENEYNPAIMYNRAVFEGESTIVQGIRDMSTTPYLEALPIAADMPAMAEINIDNDGSQVKVSGRVARSLVESPLYLSCYLVEDGISAERYPQEGLEGDPDAPADLKDVFHHNGVILHYFTKSAAGDRLEVSADGTYENTFAIADPEGFGGTGRRIVAIVHPIDKNNLRGNAVLNAAQISLTADGIRDLNDSRQRTASDNAIYDLAGRRISDGKSVTSGTRLQRGIYVRGNRKIVVAP